MPHPLDGARAKLDRARHHLEDLDTEVHRYVETQPVEVETREQEEGELRRIQLVASAKTEPAASLGLIVGDWANNVRSALDYTVYQLVRAETGEADPRWTQFPIITDQARYAEQAKLRLRGTPKWSLPVFEGLQPFQNAAEASDHHFAVLADLSNRDKHRLVHTTALQISGSQARVSGTGFKAIHQLAQNPGSIVGERIVLDAVITVDEGSIEINLEAEFDVSLEGYEVPVVPLLRWITDEAATVVEWFVRALD
jgi:hypothetical protein